MRMFRSFSVICAMAFAMCGFSFSAYAGESLAHQLTYRLCASDSLGYHASVDKLHAELAYNADAKVLHASTVNSDLMRDSNGFRQTSAIETGEQIGVGEGIAKPSVS